MCLLTGSLWGRPMWGTYWVWDARLTSVLVLFLMYLGVIALWRAIDDPTRAARATARERVRPRRLALITSQRQVSQQLTDGAISIGAFPLSFVCSQPRPSR